MVQIKQYQNLNLKELLALVENLECVRLSYQMQDGRTTESPHPCLRYVAKLLFLA